MGVRDILGDYGSAHHRADVGEWEVWGEDNLDRSGSCCPLWRLHCLVHQRCRISTIGYSLARPDLPHHLPPCLRAGCVGTGPNTIRQPRSPEIRLYPGHPRTIRPLYNLRHNRERCVIPGLSGSWRESVWQIFWRLCVDFLGSVFDYKRKSRKG